jgi:hypothetical protein
MRVILVTFAAVLVFGGSSLAQAAQPVRERIAVHLTGPAPAVSGICGFAVTRDISGDLIQTTFVDKNGDPTRFLEVAPGFRVTFMANGKSVTYMNVFSLHRTFNADGSVDEAQVGLVYRAIVPGDGSATVNAGRLLLHIDGDEVTVMQDAGPSDDFQGICRALAADAPLHVDERGRLCRPLSMLVYLSHA